MREIVINTVQNVYVYEHGLIHLPCRKATYIHLFYSILSLFGVCRLIFTCITILAVKMDTWGCTQMTGSSPI